MQYKIITTTGFGFLFFGILLLIFNSLMDRGGLHTTAKVVACEIIEEIDKQDQQQKKFYVPTLSFLDAGGKEHTKKFQKTNTIYSIGQEINIIYNPKKPSIVSIDSPWSSWWVPFVFVIIGVGILVFLLGRQK